MKIKNFALGALCALALTSCDDTTEGIGNTITGGSDLMEVSSASFNLESQSVLVDSILGKNSTGYLGRIIDPETGDEINCDFTTKFHTMANLSLPHFKTDSTFTITNSDGSKTDYKLHVPLVNDSLEADSCIMDVFISSVYGDSLAPMKVTAYEMAKTMNENTTYFSNFNPMEHGMIRENGIKLTKTYTPADLTRDTRTINSIRFKLNDPYTKNGVRYNSYGSYILHEYMKKPANLRNDYLLAKNIIPGFHCKSDNGAGAMLTVLSTYIYVYYHIDIKTTTHKANDNNHQNDSTSSYTTSMVAHFAGSPEVTQHTYINTNKEVMQKLAADNSMTYIKSPAGIYTELTFPVEEIYKGHDDEIISQAKINLQKINNSVQTENSFSAPQYVVMLQKDSVDNFFKESRLPDNLTSYLAAYSSTTGYTFSNVGALLKSMKENHKNASSNPDWNKVVLVPVKATYTQNSYSGTSTLTGISLDMAPHHVKLVGGKESKYGKINIDVIYSKFK